MIYLFRSEGNLRFFYNSSPSVITKFAFKWRHFILFKTFLSLTLKFLKLNHQQTLSTLAGLLNYMSERASSFHNSDSIFCFNQGVITGSRVNVLLTQFRELMKLRVGRFLQLNKRTVRTSICGIAAFCQLPTSSID